MSKKPTPFNQIIAQLQSLHKSYPQHNLGRHLSLAFADYGDVWGVPDKELHFALEKYQLQLETDPIASTTEIDKIISDGINLDPDTFFDDEEEEDY